MKVDEQTKASRKGYDMDILPPDLIAYNKDVQRTLENVQSGDDRMFITSIVVTVIESSKKKLDDMLSLIQAIASQEGCQIKTLDYRQEQGFMSSLPLGICLRRWNCSRNVQKRFTAGKISLRITLLWLIGNH